MFCLYLGGRNIKMKVILRPGQLHKAQCIKVYHSEMLDEDTVKMMSDAGHGTASTEEAET